MEKKNHVKPDDNKKTTFTAIFEPGFNSQTLKIPPGLLKQGTHQVILSSFCREGRRWIVELYEFSKNQVFFSNGWEHFVQDHDLYEGDFLEFEYDGENLFKVRIFQKKGLKRVYSNVVSTNQEEPTSKISTNQLKRQRTKNSYQKNLFSDHNTPAKKKMVKENHKASFSEIFEPGFNSQTLKIPLGLLPQGTRQSILTSFCREGHWIIDLYEFSKNQVFFSIGWERFVQDHDLHERDFLVFEYDGDNLFNVRIFQQNGLEKVYSNATTTTNQQEPTSKRSNNLQLIKRGTKLFNHKKLSFNHSIPGMEKEYHKVHRKTKPFFSQNPFFSRLMKHYNVKVSHTLPIPKSMVNTIFPEKRMEVTLKNKEGRGWVVKKSNTYRGQTFLLPGGWKRFVLDNSLKVGDFCIFELVAEGKLQVHIL